MNPHLQAQTNPNDIAPASSVRSPERNSASSTRFSALTPTADKHLQAYQKAMRHVEKEEYSRAADLLNHAGESPDVLNAKGVCQMRLGATVSAVATYRSYVLDPGSAMVRTTLPVEHIINFSTALLLSGRPAGCLEVLGNLQNSGHPMVQNLKQAIAQWSAGLSWWSRLNWRFGRIEPAVCQVPVHFVPGILVPSHVVV